MAVGAPPPEEAHVCRGACLVYVAIGVAGVVVLSLLAASRPGSWPARKNRKRMATLLLAYGTRLALKPPPPRQTHDFSYHDLE